MLYLIINEMGEAEHRWSGNPEKDFAGLIVKGPALVDENGNPYDSDFLYVDEGGDAFFSQAKKDAKDALEEQDRQEKEAKKLDLVSKLDNLKLNGSKDIKDLIEILGL